MTTPELLPCPFCGGDGAISEDDRGRARYVSCDACEADGPTFEPDRTKAIWAHHRRQGVVDAWNRRTARTLTPEQVERARALSGRYTIGNRSASMLDEAIELLREVVGDD